MCIALHLMYLIHAASNFLRRFPKDYTLRRKPALTHTHYAIDSDSRMRSLIVVQEKSWSVCTIFSNLASCLYPTNSNSSIVFALLLAKFELLIEYSRRSENGPNICEIVTNHTQSDESALYTHTKTKFNDFQLRTIACECNKKCSNEYMLYRTFRFNGHAVVVKIQSFSFWHRKHTNRIILQSLVVVQSAHRFPFH